MGETEGQGENISYLDCCKQPRLLTAKGIYRSNHDVEALRQCCNCGQFWFYRFHEHVTFTDDDDWTVWYSPLTPDEADRILNAQERVDLPFLGDRPSFMKDHQGVRRVKGQPMDPWS